MKKIVSLMLAILMFISFIPSFAKPAEEYIAAPYKIMEGQTISDEYLEPVYYENKNGPTIGVTMVGVIEAYGKYFKDSNNNKKLDPFEDWRRESDERAENLVKQMSLAQQAGFAQNFLFSIPPANTAKEAYDENGKVVFEKVFPYMGANATQGGGLSSEAFNPEIVIESRIASAVLRSKPSPTVLVLYNNSLNQVSEYAAIANREPAIPFTVISNPTNSVRGNFDINPNAGTNFDTNAATTFGLYPSTLGMAAAVMGDVAKGGDYSLIANYAENSRQEWDATGIDAMYGPQIDIPSDPRWSRNGGTYGEIPEIVANITTELVKGYQQGDQGVRKGGVALIMKHYPGDGSSENGFESHNKIGEWRLYPTPGSLEKYQLVPFQAAIDARVAGIMPGYSRPTADGRSAIQTVNGVELKVEEVANAYNKDIIKTLLYDIQGFEGYVNTDSGMITSKDFGVEELTVPERFAKAISAGSDVVGDTFLPSQIVEAVKTGLLPKEDLDRANTRRLKVMFDMGMFENPYEDVEAAEAVSAKTTKDPDIYKAHQKAVVLMKNHENALPMNTSKKIYVEHLSNKVSEAASVKKMKDVFAARGFTIVEDYNKADYAYIMVTPTMNNSNQMTELSLVDGLEVPQRNFPASQELTGKTIASTTVIGIGKVKLISEAVHANGGKVIGAINISSPWILSNLEPYCDSLVGIFGSWFDAQVDVLTGVYNPTGKLPITMVSSNKVIAIEMKEIDGVMREVCVSPNDVPGYDKDKYIAKEILDKVPGHSYAYYDADGNYYRAGMGLSYKK